MNQISGQRFALLIQRDGGTRHGEVLDAERSNLSGCDWLKPLCLAFQSHTL